MNRYVMLSLSKHDKPELIMNTYFVYILECSDKSFYTGVTNNIELRVGQHQFPEDAFSYVAKRQPVTCVYNEEFDDIKEAINRERQIKGWSRAKKKALIRENWKELIKLSKNYKQYPVTLRQAQGDN